MATIMDIPEEKAITVNNLDFSYSSAGASEPSLKNISMPIAENSISSYPLSTQGIEKLIIELKEKVSIIIVTHKMQQAARVK